MHEIKLTIRLGALEISYEGAEQFARQDLVDIMEQLVALKIPDMAPPSPDLATKGGPVDPHPVALAANSRLSTTDFAARLSVKSGTDLVMAAAAHLHLTRGMEDFRRADILNEMKAAKAFYRQSYGGNLTKSLDTLVKSGRLQNPGSETYALPYNEAESMKKYLQ